MDPLSLGAVIAAIAAITYVGVHVIYVAWMTFSEIRKIFLRFQKSVRITRDDVRFITKAVNSDKCSHVYGVFDARTGKIKASEPIKAENVDRTVQDKLDETGIILLT
jgi:nanoRNase/pAp phosphatase (c-di-AMP/oligoRNAs hydrolase)